ncbi:hypothetical protein RSOLAG22IIIB_05153 [Rhizoctonia solani]|uniref:Uncharacterized protein n=1 Tax=Rhizoctonia solani TaxID=456999 RepID=A0A0K6G3I4_9AGAM|nr:hypothetical protein RSOLAG22IIIB_05153 [Rhizoctonia solani]
MDGNLIAGNMSTSGSSSESDLEVVPQAKKIKLAKEPPRSESSDDSDSDSESGAPVATTGPPNTAIINPRTESSSSDSSDSDSGSESESELELEPEPDTPVPKPVTTAPKPVIPSSRASSSSESSDSSDSDSDLPVPLVAPTKSKPATSKPRASPSSSESSNSDSDQPGSTTFQSRTPEPVANTRVVETSSSDSESSSESDSSSDSEGPELPKPLERSSVRQFFSQFSSFQYDSSQPAMTEYFRMSQTEGFKVLSQAVRKKARRELKDALAKDFGQLYGYDVDDVGAWQSLCRVLRFEDVPDDLEGCQELVAATYVNIVDLVDTVSTGDPVHHFDSEKELSEYTRETGNYLSKDSPYAGSLLKFLLRKIYKPSNATRENPEPLYALNRKRKRGT